jgi:hypothetical protein
MIKLSKSISVYSYLLAGSLALTSCSSTSVNQSDYNQAISNVRIGMTKQEFLQLFPGSVPRGAKSTSNGTVEIYEVMTRIYEVGFYRDMNARLTWFYFQNNKLVEYSEPGGARNSANDAANAAAAAMIMSRPNTVVQPTYVPIQPTRKPQPVMTNCHAYGNNVSCMSQ